MSNPRDWRAKPRTTKPNSRQKRNGLYLDQHPRCGCGAAATEAHHQLSWHDPLRYDWRFMEPLCTPCHVAAHQPQQVTVVVVTPPAG